MRTLLTTLVVTLLLVVGVAPAQAVTNGTPDGDQHPYVGVMVAYDATGTPVVACSGTLLSAQVFLTAGHCTAAPAATVRIWFDADLRTGSPTPATGTPHAHPAYVPGALAEHDVGVVVLDRPEPMATYGRLPQVDQLDALRPGPRSTFTVVGYGAQAAFPEAAGWKDRAAPVRTVAYPHLVQIDTGMPLVGGYGMVLSANANTGGACLGDSGGPTFLGDSTVIAGVTSAVRNPTCAGTTVATRLDQKDVLDWLDTYLTGS